MIPEFDKNGYLPPGTYDATVEEILERFLLPRSMKRKTVTKKLRQFLELYLEHAVAIVIDGSYITSKLNPRDADICILLNDGFNYKTPEGRRLKQLADNHKRSKLHIFHSPNDDMLKKMKVLGVVEHFRTDRADIPKGILSVKVNND